MNKDELIKLKEKLTMMHKPQKYYVSTDSDWNPGKRQIVDEIYSQIDTNEAVKKFELYIENLVRYLINKGINFDKLKITLWDYCYLPAEDQDDYEDEDEYEYDPIREKGFNSSLYDIVPLGINIYDDLNDSIIDELPKELCDVNLGTVRFNEFISGMKALGYDFVIENFDEYIATLGSNKGSCIIDFSPKENHHNR